jgi:SAM-dependent methyltransferase
MGIDEVAFELIQHASLKYKPELGRVLTLGRQGVHIPLWSLQRLNVTPGLVLDPSVLKTGFCEPLLMRLGAQQVDSVDTSSYEKATYVHDMNLPVPSELRDKYDFVLDGGTIEHIFNTPQVLQNIIDTLKVGGVFCSVTCNNNFSGHGFYQFSPELFYRAFSKPYGMEIKAMWLAENHTPMSRWTSLNMMDQQTKRQMAKLNTLQETYICTIAQKVSDEGVLRWCVDPTSSPHELVYPQQYSYQEGDWKQS